MSTFKLRMLVAIFATHVVAAGLWASEGDELRDRARAVQREAAELAAGGHKEEAENLERKSITMFEEAERSEHSQRSDRKTAMRERQEQLKMLLKEAKAIEAEGGQPERLNDVRSEIKKLEHQLQALDREPGHPKDRPSAEIARRLEHMVNAIEHLKHAGLADVAAHVAERAEAAERELHAGTRHHEREPMEQIMRQLEEFRHEMSRLRADIDEIKQSR